MLFYKVVVNRLNICQEAVVAKSFSMMGRGGGAKNICMLSVFFVCIMYKNQPGAYENN